MLFSRADYDRYYNFPGEPWGYPNTRPGVRLHYNDWTIGAGQRAFAATIAATLGIGAGSSVGLIGAGFGWTGEGLAATGALVVGTDLSAYVHAEKGNTEEAELREHIAAAGLDPDADLIIGPNNSMIDPLELYLRGGRSNPQPRGVLTLIDEDGASNPSRRAIVNQIGGSVTHIITEELLNSVTDAEALQVCDVMASIASRFGGTVTHILSPLQPRTQQAPELNWKTFADWRTLLNANGFSNQQILSSVGFDPYTVIL